MNVRLLVLFALTAQAVCMTITPTTLGAAELEVIARLVSEDSSDSSADTTKSEASKEPAQVVPATLIRPRNPEATSMQWRNGEALEGELEGVFEGHLRWQTDLFDTPLEIGLETIERLDFKSQRYSPPENPFRVVLRDGSHLAGGIIAADAETLTLQSSHTGTVTIQSTELVHVERLKGAGLAIPHGQFFLRENSGSNTNTPNHWMLTAGGAVANPSFNEVLEHTATFPPKGLLSLRFRTNDQIQFSLKLNISGFEPTIETWEHELVLRNGSQFVSALVLSAKEDRELAIQLGWDAKAKRATLYRSGKQLASLAPPAEDPNSSKDEKPAAKGADAAPPQADPAAVGDLFKGIAGLFTRRKKSPTSSTKTLRLHNKGVGMFLEHFRVSEWDGTPPSQRPDDTPYAITTSSVIAAKLTGIEDGKVHLEDADGTASEIPLDSLYAFHWPRDIEWERDPSDTQAWLTDGQVLRGKLLDGERLTFQTRFSEAPVSLAKDNLRALELPPRASDDEVQDTPTPLDDLDRLSINRRHLHGIIKFENESIPRFFPVGSRHPVRLSDSEKWTLTKAIPQDAPPQSQSQALAHATSGETIPFTLTDIGGDDVSFRSDAFEQQGMNLNQVHAIQFGRPGTHYLGFDGPGWRTLDDRSKGLNRSENGIELPPHAAIGSAYAATGEEVSFKLHRNSGNSSIRIRIFTKGTDPKSGGASFLIAYYGHDIYCGPESQNQAGYMEQNVEVAVGREAPVIRLVTSGDTVQLHINKTPCGKIKLGDKRQGSGMIIQSMAIWGNSVGTSKLTNFSSHAASFMAGVTPFTDDAKREALLLPRLRRDLPPKHLLVGRNGDLLRGDIEALTSSDLVFRTGLESVRIPNDRLAAIVRLQPVKEPSENANENTASHEDLKSIEPDDSAQWIDLTNGGRIALNVTAWKPDQVEGTHPLLGQCTLPVDWIHRISLKRPSPSTAQVALSDWQLGHTKDPLLPGEEGTASPLVGKAAPDFSLTDLEGKKQSLNQLKGKVIVLDFWATWCGPCVRSLPGLIEAMAEFPEAEVAFLGVNQGENAAQIRQFLEARNLLLPVVLDEDQAVGRRYGAESIPNTVIIGRDGKVAFVKTGATPDGNAKIAEAVRQALAPE